MTLIDSSRACDSRAFTLAELLVAMMIVTLLMAGLGSAVLISSQALPSNTESQSVRMDAAALLDQIDSELAYAVAVPEREATSIAFAVPDRDGDGNAERIRYAYNPGARSITREYRGDAAQTVLTGVSAFSIEYTYEAVRESYDGLPVEDAAETLLSSNSSTSGRQAFSLANTSWIGQLISPTLPGDAVSWRLTRAQVLGERMRTSAADVRARVYSATSGGLPVNPQVEEQSLSSSLLSALGVLPIISSYSTYEVAFSGAHGFEVGESACLVIGQLSGQDGTLNLSYANGNGLLTGNSSTWAWTLNSTSGMSHACYGRITRRGSETGFDRDYLTRARISLRNGAESATRALDAIPLNRPEALARRLHLDFTELPMVVDEDGDAQPDWKLQLGAEQDIEKNGLLTTAIAYGVNPDMPITTHAIIEISFRSTLRNGESDAIRIVTEPDAGKGAAFFVSATLLSDNTQTLRILDEQRTLLYDVDGLPPSLLDVRIVFDPKLDALSVSVGGSRPDTFVLNQTALSFGGPSIQVGRLRDAVEIDDVRIYIQ